MGELARGPAGEHGAESWSGGGKAYMGVPWPRDAGQPTAVGQRQARSERDSDSED